MLEGVASNVLRKVLKKSRRTKENEKKTGKRLLETCRIIRLDPDHLCHRHIEIQSSREQHYKQTTLHSPSSTGRLDSRTKQKKNSNSWPMLTSYSNQTPLSPPLQQTGQLCHRHPCGFCRIWLSRWQSQYCNGTELYAKPASTS